MLSAGLGIGDTCHVTFKRMLHAPRLAMRDARLCLEGGDTNVGAVQCSTEGLGYSREFVLISTGDDDEGVL